MSLQLDPSIKELLKEDEKYPNEMSDQEDCMDLTRKQDYFKNGPGMLKLTLTKKKVLFHQQKHNQRNGDNLKT